MVELYAYDAAKGDCLRLRFKGASGNLHNIIIDSGCVKFGNKFIEICNGAAKEKLDFLIITHPDDDHIGGLLYAVRHKAELPFQKIIMNGSHCGTILNTPLSLRQNDEICRILFKKGAVMESALSGTTYEMDGAKIHILMPTSQLLDRAFGKTCRNIQLGKRSDYGYDLTELKDKPILYRDSSFNNAASIVFVFECDGRNLLFTGDAPAENIFAGLQEYNGENVPVEFFAVKLPHHGSVGNISDLWQTYIDSENYIICTDGRQFPDKQTIAKLLRQRGNLTIYSTTDWWSKDFLTQSDTKEYLETNKLKFIKVNGKVLEW